MKVFTIGYQGKRFNQIADTLTTHRVDLVIDVREIAWSRKPGFSKKKLSLALAERGIAYVHEPRLGSPRPLRVSYRETNDWNTFIRGFRVYLQSQSPLLQDKVRELAAGRVCLLCFEAPASECHRSAVADALRPDEHLVIS